MSDPAITQFLTSARAAQLARLVAWLRIPSISALPAHKQDVRAAAAWLAAELTRIGLEHVEVIDSPIHPLVYADWLHAGPDRPTVLIYGHFDVQPVDPLEKWTTPPFEPTVRGDDLFARGAADDKEIGRAHV